MKLRFSDANCVLQTLLCTEKCAEWILPSLEEEISEKSILKLISEKGYKSTIYILFK